MDCKGIERMKKRALVGGSWGGRTMARGLMNLRIALMNFWQGLLKVLVLFPKI